MRILRAEVKQQKKTVAAAYGFVQNQEEYYLSIKQTIFKCDRV